MQTNDQLILVDLFDRETGHADKAQAHRAPLLHRAFSVFLYDGGRLLLQKRAPGKYHSGGLWANSCCSHPRRGETLTDAAHRRLREELGADCPLQEIGAFVYYHRFAGDLYEYEYDHVLLGRCGGPFSPDPAEIAETAWFTPEALNEALLCEPERFAPWFRTACPMVLSHLARIGETPCRI